MYNLSAWSDVRRRMGFRSQEVYDILLRVKSEPSGRNQI